MHYASYFFNNYITGRLLVLIGAMSCLISCSSDRVNYNLFAGKNVLLVSIDTCRADHVQPYSDDYARTPNILSIAQDGAWFEDAVTVVPLTLPSHCTILTGLHPMRHGVRDNYNNALSDDAVTLAELFQESGYATAGMIGSIIISRREGLSQGFDYYDDQFKEEDFQALQPIVERKADRVVGSALSWLKKHTDNEADKPFFMFVHFYDPHMIYQPPAPYDEQYADNPYDGELAYTDHCLGQLIAFLKQQNLYDDLLIVLVGDHGEALGEHKELTHGLFLYEEAVRIPFIVKLPKDDKHSAKHAVGQSVSLEDVTPTLIDLCGLGPVDTTGVSLAPWLLDDTRIKDRNIVLETQYPLVYNWSPSYSLRNASWKYIHSPIPELYDLAADPDEMTNLIAAQDTPLESMQAELEDRLVEMAQAVSLASDMPITPDRVEMLASLGYAAGGRSPGIISPEEQLPDVKEKLDVYLLVDKGLGMMARGFDHKSINLFLKAIDKDPDNPTPYANLGLAYAKTRQWKKAIQYTKKALELAPQNILANLQLTRIYLRCDYHDKAKRLLEIILSDFPKLSEAHFQLGQVYLEKSDYQAALQEFALAKKWMPDMPGIDGFIKTAQDGIEGKD
jgi:arylsulfatase A-like enzyme